MANPCVVILAGPNGAGKSTASADFAFETTLASRTFAPWMEELKGEDHHFHLVYLCLPTVDLAVQRVRDRVRGGGHHVPEEAVRRRFQRGLQSFFGLYRPIADYWQFFDSSAPKQPRSIAEGRGTMGRYTIPLSGVWRNRRQRDE